MVMPAISAPISFERPRAPAVPATRKHQAMEVTSTISGDFAIAR